MLTQQLGYFKDEGLDVELVNSRAGVEAENELLAGAVQGVVGFYDHTVDLQSKGKYIQSIVQFSQAPGEVELVSAKHPEIKSPADFKGATLGVTGLGSSTDFLTQYLAVRNGLKPGDYTLLPVGAGNTFIAAVKQDQIQAGMTTEPTIAQLLKTGEASVLVDMRTPEKTKEALGGPYPAASFYVQSAWLESHKDEAQKLANAFVMTMKFIATHSAEEIADKMPKDYYAGNKDLYVQGLAGGKAMFTPDGRDAGRWPADRAQGALDIFEEPAGQADRPVEDLHDGIRRRRQVAALTDRPPVLAPLRNSEQRQPFSSFDVQRREMAIATGVCHATATMAAEKLSQAAPPADAAIAIDVRRCASSRRTAT